MKRLFLIPIIIILVVGLVLGGCGQPTPPTAPPTAPTPTPPTAPAQPIKLTFGSSFTPDNPIELINQAWIDKIKKDTNGRVEITLYTGGTLVHQMTTWDEVTAGVADIAHFSTSAARSGFDIARALPTFSYGLEIEKCLQIYKQLTKDFPEILAEFKGVKLVYYRAATSNYIFTRKPASGLNDLKGLQIQQSPSWPGLLEKMGSTGVMMPFMEVYPALQKGIIDGAILPADMFKTLAEVISYASSMNSAAPPTGFIIMNENSWNKLPSDIQKIMLDAAPWIENESVKIMRKADQDAIDFAKSKGVKVYELPSADLNTLYGYIDEIAIKKAADLDAKGIPGTKIYNAWKQLKAAK